MMSVRASFGLVDMTAGRQQSAVGVLDRLIQRLRKADNRLTCLARLAGVT
jgi:hypothetical protein